jgi:uncharacterized membrane protein
MSAVAAVFVLYVLYLHRRLSELLSDNETFTLCGKSFRARALNNMTAMTGIAMAIALGTVANIPLSVNPTCHGLSALMFFATNAIYTMIITFYLLYRFYSHLREENANAHSHPVIVLRWKILFLALQVGFYVGAPVCGMILLAGSANPIAATRGVQYINMLAVAEYGTVAAALLWISSLPADIATLEQQHRRSRHEKRQVRSAAEEGEEPLLAAAATGACPVPDSSGPGGMPGGQ